MDHLRKMKIASAVVPPLIFLTLLISAYLVFRWKHNAGRRRRRDSMESGNGGGVEVDGEKEAELLIRFAGGEDLTVHGILDAPGEVVGKSGHGTLYRAAPAAIRSTTGMVVALRFVRPACAVRSPEILPAARAIGSARHPNLVPLNALYVGPSGEKLLVHPFFPGGTLSHLLHESNSKAMNFELVLKISLGIAKGLRHLHTGMQRSPIIHGNLKTNNVLLDAGNTPLVSDFGLHLLLSPAAGQEMLDAAAAAGYKAPELAKARDAGKESDVYSLGVVFLELLTRRKPASIAFLRPEEADELHLPTSMRNLVLQQRISGALAGAGEGEERMLAFFRLAMACCSPAPSLRPDVEQVVCKLEEIGRGG